MRINTHISFEANYITRQRIKKRNQDNSGYSNITTSLVELEPKNIHDYNALCNSVTNWHDDIFGGNILEDFEEIRKGTLDAGKDKVYALTTQSGNFSRLESDKILGLVEATTRSKKHVEINFIQVRPEHKHGKNQRNFVNVGKALIKSLKQMNKNRYVFAKSAYFSTEFYEKMGFVLTNPKQLIYTWKKIK